MRRVFVDTSAFFAHLVAEDAHHPAARALFERADREAWTLITTNAVVWETYTLIRIRARNGRELDKKYSFCDALSFVVMEQLGVAEALAFDDDFRSYGKLVLVS